MATVMILNSSSVTTDHGWCLITLSWTWLIMEPKRMSCLQRVGPSRPKAVAPMVFQRGSFSAWDGAFNTHDEMWFMLPRSRHSLGCPKLLAVSSQLWNLSWDPGLHHDIPGREVLPRAGDISKHIFKSQHFHLRVTVFGWWLPPVSCRLQQP